MEICYLVFSEELDECFQKLFETDEVSSDPYVLLEFFDYYINTDTLATDSLDAGFDLAFEATRRQKHLFGFDTDNYTCYKLAIDEQEIRNDVIKFLCEVYFKQTDPAVLLTSDVELFREAGKLKMERRAKRNKKKAS